MSTVHRAARLFADQMMHARELAVREAIGRRTGETPARADLRGMALDGRLTKACERADGAVWLALDGEPLVFLGPSVMEFSEDGQRMNGRFEQGPWELRTLAT